MTTPSVGALPRPDGCFAFAYVGSTALLDDPRRPTLPPVTWWESEFRMPRRIMPDQVYRLFWLRSQIHLGRVKAIEGAVDNLRLAFLRGESMGDIEYDVRARNLLGRIWPGNRLLREVRASHLHRRGTG